MPLSIKKFSPREPVIQKVREFLKTFGYFELFILLLVITLSIRGGLFSGIIILILILLYFAERLEIINWLKDKYGN
jgi:hypothetical protein